MLLTTVPILKLLINRAMEINIQINYLSSTILQINIVEEHLVTFCVHPNNQTTILLHSTGCDLLFSLPYYAWET